MPSPTKPDDSTLAEIIEEAGALDAQAKEITGKLSGLRRLAKAMIEAGKGSEAQHKALKLLFPPRGRGASKKGKKS